MNLFVTNTNPEIAVQHLDDKRLVKMVLETGQIICTVCYLTGSFINSIPYKPTHVNHPIVKWAESSWNKIMWIIEYFLFICGEYTYRFNKIHKTEKSLKKLINKITYRYRWMMPTNNFCNCAANKKLGIDYTHITPTTKAYQMYLDHRWNIDKIKPKWTKRDKPKFYYEKN